MLNVVFFCNNALYIRQRRRRDEIGVEDNIGLTIEESFNILSAACNVKILGQSYKDAFKRSNRFLDDSVCLIVSDPPHGMFAYMFAAGQV